MVRQIQHQFTHQGQDQRNPQPGKGHGCIGDQQSDSKSQARTKGSGLEPKHSPLGQGRDGEAPGEAGPGHWYSQGLGKPSWKRGISNP